MNILTESLVEETIQAVQEAGACLSDPAAVHCVRTKSKTDYVTNVDLAVQEFLRNRLASRIPDIQFMGEEQDNSRLDWRRPCWILDPVDGTTNLIHNFRHSAVSLALSEAGQILFGVVYNPYSGECFTARRGQRRVLQWQPRSVSADVGSAGRQPPLCGDSPGTTGNWRTPLSGRCAPCTIPVPGCAPHRLRQPGSVLGGLWPSGRLCGALAPALGLRCRAPAGRRGRRAGYSPGWQPAFPVSGRPPAGLQRASSTARCKQF